MFCCEDCFNDLELKTIIRSKQQRGDCDFCSSKSALIYDLDKNLEIHELFHGLFEIYSTEDDLPSNYPKDQLDLIGNIFNKKWGIIQSKNTNGLLAAICPEHSSLLDKCVGIPEMQDRDYLHKHSIMKVGNWREFINGLRHTNRFHTHYVNTEILDVFLNLIKKPYKSGSKFYRARICKTSEAISKDNMGAPAAEYATHGRANSEGIPCLYLSDSQDTTLYEIRAGVHDYVTVGEFELMEDIEVINLAAIDKISPFSLNSHHSYAINIEHLKHIAQEIAKPLRRNDSHLDYLPTQYVSDYIKSVGHKGIEYISTMCPNGFNLALFVTDICHCTDTELFTIKSMNYEYKSENPQSRD